MVIKFSSGHKLLSGYYSECLARALHKYRFQSYRKCSRQISSSVKADESSIIMKKYPASRIRNFGIIAHIDHGKSTLSDRLMEFTGTISKEEKNEQVLDKLQVEKERGITVKAQTVSLFYEYKDETYLMNLIDTPGHVDFSHEVSRSLTACQGVLLLVDANQGVQAQTVANFNLAFSHELTIVPVLNKIDLKHANPDAVALQMNSLFGTDTEEILRVSAKLGIGIKELLDAVVERVPQPKGDIDKPFRAMMYDSWFSPYRGVICMVLIVDGSLKIGDEITSLSMSDSYEVRELGILFPEETPVAELFAGQTGYVVANIRNVKEAKIGDTWFLKGGEVEQLPQIETTKPMVFAGIYPSDQSRLQDLRKAVQKLTLNDSSVTLSIETSPALGQGWRLGFLGLLHMEVFCQRLDQEFDAQVVVTAPGVPYKVKIKGEKNIKIYGGEEIIVTNPLKFPQSSIITQSFEPMVLGTLIIPNEYYSSVLKMCMNRRGAQKNCQSVDDHTMMMVFKFPLSEIIVDFFDELKSITSGFGSFDYEEQGYEPSELTKVEMLLNGNTVEELSIICHVAQAQKLGKAMCLRLKETINPHQFQIAIQASVNGKVIARENIKALKKDVTAKLYGGDVTRRMKLLQRQAEGKKKMRMIGNVSVPRDAFMKILKR